ncbi:transposase [Nitrincola sp.]|uniref:transposase n=1 Tax=Nitrincola sp. TaxID=1926584 RepID=UPI003A9363F7
MISFQGYRQHCRNCSLKHQCLRRPNQQDGRHLYSQRLSTVELVFGNLESNKGLNRFTLRGKSKVNAQWLMCCMVHNLEKIATQGQQRH